MPDRLAAFTVPILLHTFTRRWVACYHLARNLTRVTGISSGASRAAVRWPCPVRQGQPVALRVQLRRPARAEIDGTEELPVGENLILSASFDKDGEDPPGSPPGSCLSTTATRRSAKAASRPSPVCSPSRVRACASDETVARRSPATTRADRRTPSPAARSDASWSTSAVLPTSTTTRGCVPGALFSPDVPGQAIAAGDGPTLIAS
jgi:hypothetical protein